MRNLSFRLAWLALLPLSLMAAEPTSRASYPFACTLAKPGLTTAGIFDAHGRVVRVLWTMKRKEAGELTATWNGRDDDGKTVPPGDYTWKVVLNRSVYTSLGVVGNTGLPPTTSGHVPILIEGVAVDAAGAPYTVHAWDEPGHDIIKWSPSTGQVEFHTGHLLGEALLQSIAVEPDGSHAYVSGGIYSDQKELKLGLWRIDLTAGSEAKVESFTKAGRCIILHTGPAIFPPDASREERGLVMPQAALAVQGDLLYVTDTQHGRVLIYDKLSGELKREIPLPRANGVAVAPDGRLWVGHEETKVSIFDASGKLLATPISDLREVRALELRGDALYVADHGACQVRQYTVAGTTVTLAKTFGEPQRPGDRAAERLSNIRDLAVDAQGDLLLSDRIGNGSRLQKLTPAFAPVWRQMCLEFSSQGAFGVDNPDLLLSFDKKAYKIDRKTGGWEFLGGTRTDLDDTYFGNRWIRHSGPPRVLRLNGKDFFYYPRGDGVAIYRIEPPADAERGPTLSLVSCLAGSVPTPNGDEDESNAPERRFLWSWHDEQGDHQVQKTEITIAAGPDPAKPTEGKWNWVRAAMSVDDRGWLWFVSYGGGKPAVIGGGGDWGNDGKTIYALAPHGFDKLGNPIYEWKDAVRIAAPNVGREAMHLEPQIDFGWKLANASATDGMIYALANANKPGLPGEPGLHMGGNLLIGLQGKPGGSPEPIPQTAWAVALPNMAVGLSPIPGGPGGVLIGGDPWRGGVRHYTRDGLLIGGFQSDARFGEQPTDWPSGLLDAYLAVNCNRDPRDGLLDVFTEDNVNQRLIWHRVDDRDITTSEGKLVIK